MVSLASAKISKELDAVSDYIVRKCYENGTTASNKKVQKLAYYSQAWYVVFKDGKTLFPDKIEAWMHGPAIRNLWHKYKDYGYQNVPNVSKSVNLSSETQKIIDAVFDVYGHLDAEYLEALTHREDPWLDARQGLMPYDSSNKIISVKSMRNFYGSKIKTSTA